MYGVTKKPFGPHPDPGPPPEDRPADSVTVHFDVPTHGHDENEVIEWAEATIERALRDLGGEGVTLANDIADERANQDWLRQIRRVE